MNEKKKKKKIENRHSNTDNTEKKKNKNICTKFFDFLTAHTKQITILIGRLESILFYRKQKIHLQKQKNDLITLEV
jgi:hypothetical protein